jgi:hypothetical protein
MHPKTIGLVAHTGKPGVADLVNAVAEEFAGYSMSILLEKETAAIAGRKDGQTVPELGNATDLLVVIGGDGTILQVAGQLGDNIKPIFGLNVGSLGFLTCANSNAYREAVECIVKDRINFSQRTLLEARVRLGENDRAQRRGFEPGRAFPARSGASARQRRSAHGIQRGRLDRSHAHRLDCLLALGWWSDPRSGVGRAGDHPDLSPRPD